MQALGVLQLGSGVLSHSAVTERAASTRKALARPLVSVFRGLGQSETRSQRRSVRLTTSRGASKTFAALLGSVAGGVEPLPSMATWPRRPSHSAAGTPQGVGVLALPSMAHSPSNGGWLASGMPSKTCQVATKSTHCGAIGAAEYLKPAVQVIDSPLPLQKVELSSRGWLTR